MSGWVDGGKLEKFAPSTTAPALPPQSLIASPSSSEHSALDPVPWAALSLHSRRLLCFAAQEIIFMAGRHLRQCQIQSQCHRASARLSKEVRRQRELVGLGSKERPEKPDHLTQEAEPQETST